MYSAVLYISSEESSVNRIIIPEYSRCASSLLTISLSGPACVQSRSETGAISMHKLCDKEYDRPRLIQNKSKHVDRK
jgi:hypothetical protein